MGRIRGETGFRAKVRAGIRVTVRLMVRVGDGRMEFGGSGARLPSLQVKSS